VYTTTTICCCLNLLLIGLINQGLKRKKQLEITLDYICGAVNEVSLGIIIIIMLQGKRVTCTH